MNNSEHNQRPIWTGRCCEDNSSYTRFQECTTFPAQPTASASPNAESEHILVLAHLLLFSLSGRLERLQPLEWHCGHAVVYIRLSIYAKLEEPDATRNRDSPLLGPHSK